jgi:glycosyltransferase involved in cell wall biosynthesis
MACGVPVLGSDSGEIPFVVGQAGQILGEHDEPAWQSALEQLLDDPARRRELAERGLARVRAEYAWPVLGARQLAFFESLLGAEA